MPARPAKSDKKPNAGSFKHGNKAALGNPGPGGGRKKFITEALIAKLNELDPATRKARYYKLVDKLFARAVSGKYGDLFAMKEIFDRTEGKVVAVGQGEGGEGGVHVHVTVEGGLPDDV